MWIHTLFYLHWEDVHPVHSLLQLKFSRGRHGVNILIMSVVLCVGISAVHLKDSIQYTVQITAATSAYINTGVKFRPTD